MHRFVLEEENTIQKLSLWLVLFLCVFIPLRSPLADLTSNAIKIIPDIFVILLFILYTLKKRFHIKILNHDWMFFGYIISGFISSIFINNLKLGVFIYQIRSISIYYILYFVIRNLDYGRNEYTRIIRTLQYMGTLLFFFGIIEKVTNKEVLFPTAVADSIVYPSNFTRIYSLFYNPNTYGLFIVFVIIMSMMLKVIYEKDTSLYIYVSLIVSLVLTISRSAIIILIFAGGAIGTFLIISKGKEINYKEITTRIVLGSICCLLIYFLIMITNNVYYNKVNKENKGGISTKNESVKIEDSMNANFSDRFKELQTDDILDKSASNGRIYSVKKGLEIFKENKLFGTGFGTYGSAASLYKEPKIYKKYELQYPFYADNEYIKVLVEGGILGTSFFLIFITNLLVYYRKDFSKILILIIFGWFGMFFNVMEVQIASMLFWVYLSFDNDPIKRQEV